MTCQGHSAGGGPAGLDLKALITLSFREGYFPREDKSKNEATLSLSPHTPQSCQGNLSDKLSPQERKEKVEWGGTEMTGS